MIVNFKICLYVQDNYTKLCNEINGLFNELDGDNVIDSFERKWCEWNINDAIKWFDFVLKVQNGNDRSIDYDYEIDDLSSDDESDDESNVQNTNEDLCIWRMKD